MNSFIDANMEKSLGEAYRYCQWLTRSHYENFPVASWLLPKEKRPAIAAIYAFARSADDFSDEAKYQGRSLELLNAWREALWTVCGGSAGDSPTPPFVLRQAQHERHPIFIALADAIRRCGLPVQMLDDLLTAFTLDVTKRRYADWEELMTYCRYSANPVGRLVLTVFGYPDPELHLLSDRICTALQMANHWQDLSIDFGEKDRLYVPQDMMRSWGVTEEDLKNASSFPRKRESLTRDDPRLRGDDIDEVVASNFRSLIQELVHRARLLFDAGEPLIRRVSDRRLRLELKLTVAGGRAILDRIEAAGCDVFRHRPVLSTGAKLRLLTHALLS